VVANMYSIENSLVCVGSEIININLRIYVLVVNYILAPTIYELFTRRYSRTSDSGVICQISSMICPSEEIRYPDD
jgi:hypothetical protein